MKAGLFCVSESRLHGLVSVPTAHHQNRRISLKPMLRVTLEFSHCITLSNRLAGGTRTKFTYDESIISQVFDR
jgi:hypothetical protein